MRSPERIEPILSVLREIWTENPDLRLGQLIVVASRPNEPQLEIFNTEDDAILEGLKEYQVKARLGKARV